MQSSAPAPRALSPWDSAMGAIEDSISQCTFLQMTYTAEKPHADGITPSGARPRLRPTITSDPHTTSPTPTTTGWREDRCPASANGPPQSRCSKDVTSHLYWLGAHPGRPCPVPACNGQPLPSQRRFSSPLMNRFFVWDTTSFIQTLRLWLFTRTGAAPFLACTRPPDFVASCRSFTVFATAPRSSSTHDATPV
jgi:hypothetical protein